MEKCASVDMIKQLQSPPFLYIYTYTRYFLRLASRNKSQLESALVVFLGKTGLVRA
jgi:hypothetical protein